MPGCVKWTVWDLLSCWQILANLAELAAILPTELHITRLLRPRRLELCFGPGFGHSLDNIPETARRKRFTLSVVAVVGLNGVEMSGKLDVNCTLTSDLTVVEAIGLGNIGGKFLR